MVLRILALLLLAAGLASAQVPQTLLYQGQLLDAAGQPITGAQVLTFRIYDQATDGTLLWQEADPVALDAQGLFSTILGDTVAFAFPFDRPLYVALSVDGGATEMSPRSQLHPVPYALHALNAGASTLGALDDVSSLAAATGQVLAFDGSEWAPASALGPTGATGAAGAAGSPGPTGPPGPSGPPGPQGATGAAGAQGATGPTGTPGLAGADGATGPQGPAGADGATGPQGPAGADGATGPQGPAGATGTAGASGPAGPAGPTGPTGPAGPQGPAGAGNSDHAWVYLQAPSSDGTTAFAANSRLAFSHIGSLDGFTYTAGGDAILLQTSARYRIHASIFHTAGAGASIALAYNGVPDLRTQVPILTNIGQTSTTAIHALSGGEAVSLSNPSGTAITLHGGNEVRAYLFIERLD